ncbi:MAG: alpha/beta hydrolase [Gammaproteobacteria bacterium]|nr:alpha/beta hydrolase [Gammaproteobacteria bacterium]
MFVNVKQHRVFYADGGIAFDPAKPTLVFIHGAGMDHTVWTLFTRYFARHGHNVVALDLPGHGRSPGDPLPSIEAMAAWVLVVLEKMQIEQAVLAGHSMGSLVALQAASSARVSKLALLGFSYPMQVGPPLLEAARKNEHAAIEMLMIWGHDHLAQIGGNALPGMGIITPIQRIVERAAPDVLFTDLNACHTYTGGVAAAASVHDGVHLILGDRDRMTPLKGARAFLPNFRQAELTLLKDCGHGMLEERPEETFQALAAIVQTR